MLGTELCPLNAFHSAIRAMKQQIVGAYVLWVLIHTTQKNEQKYFLKGFMTAFHQLNKRHFHLSGHYCRIFLQEHKTHQKNSEMMLHEYEQKIRSWIRCFCLSHF
ncbi:unnamed protein product [Allacma fusca]|uniref:Uncharacterized protein n=1 Tax=Allacma fusca TaxID=39272 RepID=A0A8J2PIG7_9HEXA|nr:unnamed protein product [Allacma fusca]